MIVSEREGSSERVTLYLERSGGTIGDVTLQWEITGDHAPGEIVPSEGEVSGRGLYESHSDTPFVDYLP